MPYIYCPEHGRNEYQCPNCFGLFHEGPRSHTVAACIRERLEKRKDHDVVAKLMAGLGNTLSMTISGHPLSAENIEALGAKKLKGKKTMR